MRTPSNMKIAAGLSKDKPIEVDDLPEVPVSCTSGEISTVTEDAARRAVRLQQEMLDKYKTDMEKKPAANAVSPEAAAKKRPARELSEGAEDEEDSIVTVKKTVVTKTVKDENGNLSTVVTTTETKSFGPPTEEQVIHAQLVRAGKKSKKELSKEIERTLMSCDFTHRMITDDPAHHAVNNEVKYSDVIFLNLKEFEEEDPEPIFALFANCESYPGTGRDTCEDPTEHTCMRGCNECFLDACCEYLYGPYCFAAVKRYFFENTHIATLRDAYVYYVAHYNRQLDTQSYRESGNGECLRPSTISKPTICMKEGSLKMALQWVQWQLNHGPHAEHYANERRKRDNQKAANIVKEQRGNRRTKL